LVFVMVAIVAATEIAPFPVVINTWPFTEATEKAWEVVTGSSHNTAVDAVEQGCTVCEILQCDGSVGYGGSPDESGETTLDAMIMNGNTFKVGAVGDLRRVKSAISVARYVLEHTRHTLLVGDSATQFAVEMGFQTSNLTTPTSEQIWEKWKANNCQPNFWVNVVPSANSSCGPYQPAENASHNIGPKNHDTIGMVVIDQNQNIAAGTSTNGLTHKIPGRVGDSPIAGAGCFADTEYGGCAATGDGDVMMRFLPCYQAVENLRNGMSPKQAAESAITRIITKHPDFQGALVVINKDGVWGAACHGWIFKYSVMAPGFSEVQVFTVNPIQA